MLSIIIPVYNEADNIINLLNQIDKYIKSKKEVLIIYDFDEDSTIPVIRRNLNYFSRLNIKIIKNDIGSGVANALKKGFKCAEGEYLLVLMADLSDDLSIAQKMIERMDDGYDIVCGSRYMKGGNQIGGGFFKKNLSKMAGKSMYIFTGIPTHDITNNFKMYRKSVLDNIEIESVGGFEVAMEVTIKAYKKGYKITELPSIWYDRTSGKSKFKIWKWLPHYLKWYFYCIFKRKNLN